MFEIRNYHIDPDHFSGYQDWAKTYAVPFLKGELNIIGFWVNSEETAEAIGDTLDPLGAANVTWIIQWQNREQRDARMEQVFTSAGWEEIFAKLSGGLDIYLRREEKFVEAL